jgi:hypothetical protein
MHGHKNLVASAVITNVQAGHEMGCTCPVGNIDLTQTFAAIVFT